MRERTEKSTGKDREERAGAEEEKENERIRGIGLNAGRKQG